MSEKKSSDQNKETARSESQNHKGFTMKDAPKNQPMQLDFSTFVFSLATGAYIHLGLAEDPTTHKVEKNVVLARQNIDILIMLRDKTQGNLSNDENQLLSSLIADVQLRFVEGQKAE